MTIINEGIVKVKVNGYSYGEFVLGDKWVEALRIRKESHLAGQTSKRIEQLIDEIVSIDEYGFISSSYFYDPNYIEADKIILGQHLLEICIKDDKTKFLHDWSVDHDASTKSFQKIVDETLTKKQITEKQINRISSLERTLAARLKKANKPSPWWKFWS